jgi:hypothetical protein
VRVILRGETSYHGVMGRGGFVVSILWSSLSIGCVVVEVQSSQPSGRRWAL